MSTRRFPRMSRPWLVGLCAGLLVLSGTACSGTTPVRNAMNANASPSFVSAWNIQLRSVGNGQAQLSYRPLVSSARKHVGADHRSDGKTLWVTLRSCLVTENCSAMSPAQPAPGAADPFTYVVVLPYKGEKVIVQGQGEVQEELPVTR